MARPKKLFDEKGLAKGDLRKLNALRKSIGPDLAEEAFAKWLSQRDEGGQNYTDPNIEAIQGALAPMLDRIKIAHGSGYLIRRGRGRFVVEPVNTKE